MEQIKFTTYDAASKMPESPLGGLGGFFNNGMRWEDYLKRWPTDLHPRLEALKAAIIENNIQCTGARHQHDDYDSAPIFEDGTAATYSYRAWGDLMAAIWSTQENKDYSYLDFYC